MARDRRIPPVESGHIIMVAMDERGVVREAIVTAVATRIREVRVAERVSEGIVRRVVRAIRRCDRLRGPTDRLLTV
jgi:hypothetical protein